MDKKRNILNYWYSMVKFSPFWPKITIDTICICGSDGRVPWISEKESKCNYNIYLGKIESQELFEYLRRSVDNSEKSIEKVDFQSCLCALQLDSDGKYINNTFSVSAFVWAAARILEGNDWETNFELLEIDKIKHEMNDILISIDHKFEREDLEQIYTDVLNKTRLNDMETNFYAVINKKLVNEGRNADKTDLLTSFYISDINMIQKEVQNGDSIVKYIEALCIPHTEKIEMDNDVSKMKKWLLPEKYPLGKWPSLHSPNLMQQIAINMGISGDEQIKTFFSVNNPPGTGKMILLKEIIASYIVERSILLSKYENPDEAFTKCQFDLSEKDSFSHYYRPASELKKYGILLTSNNNEALEQVSKELSKCFSGIALHFMRNDDNRSGDISDRLDEKSNMNDLLRAKKAFHNKYLEVLEYRKQIQEAVRTTVEHILVKKEYESAKIQLDIISKERIEQKKYLKEISYEEYGIHSKMVTLEKNAGYINRRLSLWKRLFSFLYKKDPVMRELKYARQQLDTVTIRHTEQNAQLVALHLLLDKTELDYEKERTNFENKEIMLQRSSAKIQKYKKQFGKNYAEEEFWMDIQKNENSQESSPWTDKAYDTLREELFYCGLMLHKAFILNSRCVKQNINCLVNMWSGNFSEKNKMTGFTDLMNTLFLVIPVISIVFDSVSSLLKYADKNGLGTLIIDKADKAAPYCALGALWRTCKAIVVGDPLQPGPEITVPKVLSERFADEFEIELPYRSYDLSVQMLTDSINPFGGYRENLCGRMWIGIPLVVQRKCLNPMFIISNQIAYNSRLFNKFEQPSESVLLSLSKSVWVDTKEDEKAIQMVTHAFEIQNGFPSLYIISLFPDAAVSFSIRLKRELYRNYPEFDPIEMDNWIEKSCGTIYTFQDKEANEVIINLNCSDRWGTNAIPCIGKLNILNAAMSTAKYRVAVIGSSDEWKKIPDYDMAYEVLCKV